MATGFRSPSKVLRRLKVLPLAARKLSSWPRFMCNYALGLVPAEPYAFRNRARLRIGRGVDHVPIIEIFLREDYGRIDDGAVIVDLGANIGVFTVYAATTARNVRILAYEPMADFFRLLQDNVGLNRLSETVTCFNCAVGADSRPRDLIVEGAGILFPTLVAPPAVSGARKISVPCTTLAEIIDSNGLDKVDLLKMDCEGAEYEILYGAPPSCFGRIREIRMEYHDLDEQGRNRDGLVKFLQTRGYEVTLAQATSGPVGNLWARRHD